MPMSKLEWSKGLVGKVMAVPLSVALAAGLAPSAALAADEASLGAASANLSTQSAMSTPSLYNEFIEVLFHAANGLDEFADDYRACGGAQWAPQYFMFDLGNDGVPEMFVRSQSFAGNKVVHAFTVKSGKVVNLGSYLEGAYGTAGNANGRLFVAGWGTDSSYVNTVSISGNKIVSKFAKSGKATAAEPSKHVQVVADYLGTQEANWLSASSVNDYGALKSEGKYSLSKATLEVASGGAFTGAPKKPRVTVKLGDMVLTKNVDYKVAYRDNVNAGTGAVTVTGVGNFKGSIDGTFTIAKAANTLVPVAASKTFANACIQAKDHSYKPFTFTTKGQGKLAFKNVSGAAIAKKCVVNPLTGAVTVKKGTPRGTYEMKVKVIAAGDANHKPGTKTVSFKVAVK